MTPSPLLIHFGNQAVSLQCDESELAAYLAEMFQHCLGGRFLPRTHYHISRTDNGRFTLSRDAEILRTGPTAASLLPWLMQDLVAALIEEQTERLIFHAAGALVNKGGIMLIGQTGSGKSTLTAHLLSDGAQYLSDEVLALAPGFMLMITGLARPLVLKAPPPVPTSPLPAEMVDGSRWLLPAWLGADVATDPAPLHLLLFPTYQADVSLMIQRLSPAEAAFHLLQNLVNARNLPEKGLPAVTDLARQVPAYQIAYSEATAVTAWVCRQQS